MSATVERLGLSRRTLLKAGLKAGTAGALLVGFRLPFAEAAAGAFAPNAFISIAAEGTITLIMPQVEMGQGVYTSIAMILAEELDADFAQVRLEHAPPDDKLYGNPLFGIQVTGNSNSIRAFWAPLRKAGATARALLVLAAAQQWQVDPKTCRTAAGQVIHDASGRMLPYGKLTAAAAVLPPPTDVALKAIKDFILVGKPMKRLDTPDKVTGKAQYGIDAMPPGVKFATLALSPVFGGKVAHVDDSQAKSVPGLRQVVVLDDVVAVVGDHMWA
ncbi:MAG TPA: molybdopterin cofactor-binding domain-containing protein, partial [Dongiaceae bacterium]